MPNEAAKTNKGLSETRRFMIGASCAVATVTIWAGWLVAMRFGVTTRLSAADLTALRFATAGVVLLPVVLRNGIAVDRLGWAGLIAVVIGAGAPQVLLVGLGLLFAPVAHAGALFQGLVPLATACLAVLLLQERSAALQRVGLVLIIVGAAMMGGFDVSNIGGRQSIGDLLLLIAAVLVAGYTVAIRRARLNGLHAAAIAAVASLLIYVPIYLLFIEDGLFRVPVAELVFQALYQGVLTAAVSFALYGYAISLLGASRAAAFIALAPVMATLLAVAVLGERPAPLDWAAIMIITAGVYLAGGGPLPRRLRSRFAGAGKSVSKQAAPPQQSAADVLAFWRAAGPDRWFEHDAAFDAAIRERFAATYEDAAARRLGAWENSAEDALALVIVLDQFPRNMFRHSARAFATDPLAREVARRAIVNGFDQRIAMPERAFFYLPFEHSEALADQERAVALMRATGDADQLKWAELHADIVRRFGRFPHRNAVLGRATTPDEQAFLDSGGFAG